MENKVIFIFKILLDKSKHNLCSNTVIGDFSKGKKKGTRTKPKPTLTGKKATISQLLNETCSFFQISYCLVVHN